MLRHVPDLGVLELMDSVARLGSLSAAAREHGVTQQAVSARIRVAEQRLGFDLFERSPTGVRLTHDGAAVLVWTREVLAAADRFADAVTLLHDGAEQSLTVGGSQTVAAYLLPGWILRLRARQLAAGAEPTTVHLRVGNSAQVAHLVRDGKLDLGFVESPRPAIGGLERVAVLTDPLTVVVPPAHPWRDTIRLADLARTPLVAREPGSGTRGAFEHAVRLRLHTEPAPAALVLATTTAVISAVGAGVAPAVVSARAVADDVQLGRVRTVRILDGPVERPITALWRSRRGGGLGESARALVEIASAP